MLIKICGLKDPNTACTAVELGADMIGLVFYQPSKRFVDISQAKQIADAVKQINGEVVALFVDANIDTMFNIIDAIGTQTVQLHGAISRKMHHQLPKNIRRIYAVHVDAEGNLSDDQDQGLQYLDKTRDLLLFDSVQGGSGACFAWKNFKNPYDFPFLLAGGLQSENVSDAIKICRPNGVDVSSGVEIAPGKKDIGLIQKFIETVKNQQEIQYESIH